MVRFVQGMIVTAVRGGQYNFRARGTLGLTLALVNETVYVCIVTRKKVGGRCRWRRICPPLSLSIEQFCLCAS